MKLLKYFGITSNDSLIFIEAETILFTAKTNSGLETITIEDINTNIKVNSYEKFGYVAITFPKLLRQLFLQKNFYKYLYLISIISRNSSSKNYLRKSILTCNKLIKKIRNLYLGEEKFNSELKFDSWFLQNIQYSFNDSSLKVRYHLNLFILKSTFGINKSDSLRAKQSKETFNTRKDNLSHQKKDKFPKKV